MKNKDRYLLTELSFEPKSLTNGCGKRVLGYEVEVFHHDQRVARFRCEKLLAGILEWLEKEA